MVSDVVLSKELPDFIKDSVDAYVGCISGAIPKDKYLKTVTDVGFKKVEIVDEISIPVDDWVSDPLAASIAEKLKMSTEKKKEVLGSVVSVKIKAVKQE
jgi:hypothetical protein